MLRWFSCHGLLDPDDARDRLVWANGDFSPDASVCIAGQDRAGLERLPRAPFALERIEQQVGCRPPKPQRDGRSALSLTPPEFIEVTRISPARGPTVEAVPDWDALAQPQPEYVIDQQVQR